MLKAASCAALSAKKPFAVGRLLKKDSAQQLYKQFPARILHEFFRCSPCRCCGERITGKPPANFYKDDPPGPPEAIYLTHYSGALFRLEGDQLVAVRAHAQLFHVHELVQAAAAFNALHKVFFVRVGERVHHVHRGLVNGQHVR